MHRILLLTFGLILSTYAAETSIAQVLPLLRLAHTLLLTHVYLNGHGPFRMVVDTGATSSTLNPDIASLISAQPTHRVEQVTASGSAFVAAGPVRVRTGNMNEDGIEMLFSALRVKEADGILGQNWLQRFTWQMDYQQAQLVLNGPPPAAGQQLPLLEEEGRPYIMALLDGVCRPMVVDSGASMVVVFGQAQRYANNAQLETNNGSAQATYGEAQLELPRLFRRNLLVAAVPGTPRNGLLPASLFRSIYVNRRAGVITLIPR
jgi:predicted aspartyl protease